MNKAARMDQRRLKIDPENGVMPVLEKHSGVFFSRGRKACVLLRRIVFIQVLQDQIITPAKDAWQPSDRRYA
jgi:hypothetical protein